MCNPAVIGLAMMAVGGAVQANQQRIDGEVASNVAEYNAKLAERKAQDTVNRGQEEENKHRRKVSALKGQQKAQFGASGVELDSGSASDILAETEVLGEYDALTIRGNAEREAQSLRDSARVERYLGKQKKEAGKTRAVGTAITTAGSVAGGWNKAFPGS